MKHTRERFGAAAYLLCSLLLAATLLLCVCAGSVAIPLPDTVAAIAAALRGAQPPEGVAGAIILSVRLPRVLCVALTGASLSLCGAAMQGLLRNPLADGSTLGVSSGASLGAVLALALGVSVPGLPLAGTAVLAMGCAFLSLLLILSLAYALDRSLATQSIILIGVIFSMFASSLISLIIAFAPERARTITFWTMGSLSGSNYAQALLLAGALLLCGAAILGRTRELNAFAVGEDNARHVGVNVRGGVRAHRRVRVRGRDHRLCGPGRAAHGAHDRGLQPRKAFARVAVCRRDLPAAGRPGGAHAAQPHRAAHRRGHVAGGRGGVCAHLLSHAKGAVRSC